MSEGQDARYSPPSAFSERSHIGSFEQYSQEYQRSIEDPEAFWAEKAARLDWIRPWDKVCEWDFEEPSVRWFEGGQLNASVNCLDRHIEAGRGDDTAIIWEGNDPSDSKSLSYRELHAEVCRFASGLRSLGVQKGDRVCIYLPMVIELLFRCWPAPALERFTALSSAASARIRCGRGSLIHRAASWLPRMKASAAPRRFR